MAKRNLAGAVKKAVIGCRFDAKQVQKLKRIAKEQGVQMTTVLRWCVNAYPEAQSK